MNHLNLNMKFLFFFRKAGCCQYIYFVIQLPGGKIIIEYPHNICERVSIYRLTNGLKWQKYYRKILIAAECIIYYGDVFDSVTF